MNEARKRKIEEEKRRELEKLERERKQKEKEEKEVWWLTLRSRISVEKTLNRGVRL